MDCNRATGAKLGYLDLIMLVAGIVIEKQNVRYVGRTDICVFDCPTFFLN